MKPSETNDRAVVWRFSEIAIDITYDRRSRIWVGAHGTGRDRIELPWKVTDKIVLAHEMEKHIR